jgi:hypothetical protein
MVTRKVVIDQLNKINFKHDGWGRSEVSELPHIILPDEEIYECVNGYYDGGFALLVATNIRVLLIDKKPLNYLSVEDMRFDMISEMDYNHRLFGADISISSGGKNLHFRSYNQARLRKLIGHVQHCMAESKKKQDDHQEGQIQHLEQINKQLQSFLIAQQQYQNELDNSPKGKPAKNTEPPKPSNELADFLYAQSLLAHHRNQTSSIDAKPSIEKPIEEKIEPKQVVANIADDNPTITTTTDNQMQEMYQTALQEVYSNRGVGNKDQHIIFQQDTHEINPIMIAYSKLPFLLRSRKFNETSTSKIPDPTPSSA